MTVDSLDCLAVAINSARKFSERLRDFENNRVEAKVTVNLTTGALISAITDLSGNALSVKTIKSAGVPYGTDSIMPIALLSRDAHLGRLSREFASTPTAPQASEQGTIEMSEISLVRMGQKIYLSPNDPQTYGDNVSTTVVVYMDVIKFLPDYSGDSDSDFFLEHCYDYLVLRTVQQLNAFLKEDQRLPFSTKLMEEAWRSVVEWDNNMVVGSTDTYGNLE